MLGMEELKENIEITETTVECPVKGCIEKVERQREVFKREERFKCPKHNIYISPTTFEYQSEADNILWKEKDDLNLLNQIKAVKRESRIARDNSEDAVSWNVFRFLERNDLVDSTLSSIINFPLKSPELIYWSYSQKENNSWLELNNARKEFGENLQRSSEPDLIIKSADALFFIEAKVTAPNRIDFNKNHTVEEREERIRRYSKGNRFLSQPVKDIIDSGYYELMRFWVIGSSIADRLNLDFRLVNLVLSEREKNIEAIFRRYLSENQKMRFIRITWEDLYQQILRKDLTSIDKDSVIRYFRNKSIGYDGNGKLQKAFSI